ncbi:oligogalacturonate lyase family protein [Horticoccus luteus]|uniref:Oligogalacturonate lyase family protein n=1 Tax=Horticoccus luteus TaxID=2862869 RepID=A0A8F9XG20_9BACT|nr:oligogalacturonate lyase family protein [Horticoccus luteus]QYM77740.1 oligogalacturonate lyase family protein [Horticoccus luteus]
MKNSLLPFLLILLTAGTTATAAEFPTEWVDPATGHRVVQLSREPGTHSLYFNQNAYTPDGRKLIVTSPSGISTIDLATRAIELVVPAPATVIVVGHKTGAIYYSKREGAENWIYAADPETKAIRKLVRVPRGGVATVNADETLMAGTFSAVDEEHGWQRGGAADKTDKKRTIGQAEYTAKWPDGTPMVFAEAKEYRLHEQLARIHAEPPRSLFTLNLTTGEVRVIHRESEWLNHLQFSPTDPGLLMFCHEGPWHEVDRLWTIRTDGTGLTKVHTRTMNMEIWGHEWFGADGKTIWYDLQTPRGEVFWVAGYDVATGRRTWYALDRNEWSVHFNVSPDGTLFAGDGGDREMVAHAPDGKWLYLFRPHGIPDVAGIKAPNAAGLIHPGRLVAEKMVNLSSHNYKLEPNVTFSPDQKWLIFRSNMHGATQVYAVEIAKAK